MQTRINSLLADSLDTLAQIAEGLVPLIEEASSLLVQTLLHEHRLFVCGNGASGSNVHGFASKLGNRYDRERPALPVITLGDVAVVTAIAADGSFRDVFSRPLQALARPGDVLLVLSAQGNAGNIVQAAEQMQQCGGRVIALTGPDGGELGRSLQPGDIHLALPGNHPARVHEAQLFVLNCFCDLIDREFFGANDVC
jgi:phosphoheptose isomerase